MIGCEARRCYFVMETQKNSNGEYRALIAVEGESGYHVTDWLWGKDINVAEATARQKNEMLGISAKDAAKIVCSTMRVW